jgi:hypothetical protein
MLLSRCVIGGDSGTACTKDDDCLGEKRCVSGLCLSFQQAKEYVLSEPSREVSRSEVPMEMSVGEESVVSTDSFSGDAGELISGDRSSDAPGSDTEPLDAVPASFGPSRLGLSAGGGTMKSANYRLQGKIGPSFTQSAVSFGGRQVFHDKWRLDVFQGIPRFVHSFSLHVRVVMPCITSRQAGLLYKLCHPYQQFYPVALYLRCLA